MLARTDVRFGTTAAILLLGMRRDRHWGRLGARESQGNAAGALQQISSGAHTIGGPLSMGSNRCMSVSASLIRDFYYLQPE